MGALMGSGLVSTAIHLLPASLLRLLDAWSYRRARQRADLRRQQWLRAQAGPAPRAPSLVEYRMKPWRD